MVRQLRCLTIRAVVVAGLLAAAVCYSVCLIRVLPQVREVTRMGANCKWNAWRGVYSVSFTDRERPATDADLAVVSRLPDVTVLYLQEAAVTPHGIDHLRAMVSLRVLVITSDMITIADIDRVAQHLPHCRLIILQNREHGIVNTWSSSQ